MRKMYSTAQHALGMAEFTIQGKILMLVRIVDPSHTHNIVGYNG